MIRLRIAWWIKPAVMVAYVPRALKLISAERCDRICQWLMHKALRFVNALPASVAEAEQVNRESIARAVADSEIIL